MKRILIAVLFTFLFAVSIGAQQSEVINVQVTNLDVVVTDSKGKRVSGLTKDDFEVLEDGKSQAISNLSEFGNGSTNATESIQPVPRRILLIVDNGSIALSARRKVFTATRATLERLLIGPSDRIAIATVSHSLQQRLAWTADKAAVLDVLNTIEKDAILPHADLLALERLLDGLKDDADAAAATMGPPKDRDGNEVRDTTPGGSSGSSMGGRRQSNPVDFQTVIATGRSYAASATNDTKQTLSSLGTSLNAFAQLPGGRKIVILVGGGLPLNAAEAVFQRIETVRDQAELSGHRGFTGTRSASTMTQISGYDITPLVDTLAAAAKLKGIAFYAVNPELGDRQGSRVTSRSSSDHMAEFAAMRGMVDGYQRLAAATGGAAMIGRPADQVLTEIVSDLESYYSLGYRASGPLNPKSQIVVKVKKGLTARATISSGAFSRDWEVSDQVLANHLLEPANPLNISLVMDPAVVDSGGKKTIPMKIMIPVNSLKLVQEGSDYTTAFTVFISFGSNGGNGSDPSRQEQSFRWPENTIAQVKGKTIGFAVSLEIEPDRDRVSVGVLDQYSGAAGFARAMLQ